jgi:predicted O-methyltransferase YrrM
MNNAPNTRADLAHLIPANGIMVELGVAAGNFAVELMSQNPHATYVGVDRWSDHHDERERVTANQRINQLGGIALRSTFADALWHFLDQSLDMVYVDGYAHTGQDGGKTLADWWPKVKSGGIFAGHDYDNTHYPQTVQVVDSFMAQHGLTLHIINEKPHASWWVVKP